METYSLSDHLDLDTFLRVSLGAIGTAVPKATRSHLATGAAFLRERIEAGEAIYGVNTGFGPLVGRGVDAGALEELQENLLQQLSCNVGPPLPAALARGTLLLRARAIGQGVSGATPELLDALVAMIESGATPVIRAFGSVGASGDLVPLARLARVLKGEGEIRLPTGEISAATPARLEAFGLKPVRLKPKEGLALVNGTSFSLSITAFALDGALRILEDRILPLSATLLLLFEDSLQHLSELVYERKAHPEAVETASDLRDWLDLALPEDSHGVPQPPYSSRSLALWIGVARSHFRQARETVEVEMNSVDDNPLIFPEGGKILHTANFQGVYAAKAADDVALGLIKLSNLMERQLNRLFHDKLNGDLPPFLAPEPVGLHSGLQGFQLLATSLLAEIRTRATAHGSQSFPTNGDNQDVVSMSANAALNALEVTRRSAYITSVFECSLARALQLRQPALPEGLRNWWQRRAHLLEVDYASASLDRVLEDRKRELLPWDEG